jgi:hypothetical protein
MYANHVAFPNIAATVVAVNGGFALVEMMDGSGTRQCAVSELTPIASMTTTAPVVTTAAPPMPHHSNMNSINADPSTPTAANYWELHDQRTDLALAEATAGLDLLASSAMADPMEQMDAHLFCAMDHLDQGSDVDTLGFDM